MSSNGKPPQSSDWTQMTLKELQDKASIDVADTIKYTPKQWLSAIAKLYKEGDRNKRCNNQKMAYYYYLKGCNIMVEILNRHPRLNQVQQEPDYIETLKRTSDEILDNLYRLKKNIEQVQQLPSQQYPQSLSTSEDEVDIGRALKKYPELTDLDDDSMGSLDPEITYLQKLLPPAPTHDPHAGGRVPTPEPLPVSTRKPVSPTIPAQALQKMDMTTPQPPGSDQHFHLPQNSRPVPGNPSSKGLPIPGLTNFNFPQTMVVDPDVLAHWIANKPNQPSVLLLDVRPRSMYEDACIRHRWVCQIEPLILRQGVTSDKIQTSLTMSNETHQELFKRRHEFDLIVYYDQDSKRLEDAHDPLRNLRLAIYENEFNTTLPRVPMMLAGGFSGWRKAIGDRGVFVLNASRPGSQPLNNAAPTHGTYVKDSVTITPRKERMNDHWLRNVVGRGPVDLNGHVHSSTFDYFMNKQKLNDIPPPAERPETRVPPLQGTFANSLEPNPYSDGSLPITMPIAHPSGSHAPSTDEANISLKDPTYTNYPEIRPNRSGAFTVRRQNTYIDNPFNGFTETKNDLYEVPPIPPKPRLPLRSPPAPPPHAVDASPPPHPPSAPPQSITQSMPPTLPAKPAELMTSQHAITDTRQAPVSDSSISQLGSVVIGTTGLKNLGNTCFMNSIVQCLSGTIPLARYLISGTYKRDVNKSNPLGTGGVLVQSFADLLRTMWSGSYSFISPVAFREALARFAPQFAGTDQQDSQEFLLFLLDGLHEDINLIKERPSPQPENPEEEARFERLSDWEASAIAWAKYMERNRSIVVDLFQGQYRSRLTCLTCKHTSTTYNTFMSLSLPIPKGKSAVSLYQCLDMFVKEEVLEKDDAWHCPHCKTLRRSTKILTISRLPVVLLIHLKRFSFEGPFHNKLETMVNFPARDLDLSRYVPDTMYPSGTRERPIHRYDLYGVSNHYGSLTAGHYTACVRNGYRQEWHYFDDTRFSVCDEGKAIVSELIRKKEIFT
ncbi:hypothetical protein BX666DRAFT_1892794 [Dichotomocladium elegans]|nr:hypothetical protein BX666DRAFT_1892794 [Dichotomocladium elegans]